MTRALQNMKIFTRLIVGFGITIALTMVLIIVGITTITSVSSNYRDILEYTQHRTEEVLMMRYNIMDLRRVTTAVNAYVGDVGRQEGYRANATDIVASINANVQEYIHLTSLDPGLNNNEALRASMIDMANNLNHYVDQYLRLLVLPNIAFAIQNDKDSIVANAAAQAGINDNMQSLILHLLDQEMELADAIEDSVMHSTYTARRVFLVIGTITMVLSVFFAVTIAKSITKPIGQIMDVANNVSQGKFNVNLATGARDETGMLATSFGVVVSNINNIVIDINNMREEHEHGNIDTRLASERYNGAYKEISDSINTMVNSYVVIIKDILAVLTDITEGSFTKDMQEYDGKDMGVKAVVSELKHEVTTIVGEIDKFVTACSNGDLHHHASVGDMQGKWADIINGLNRVLEEIAVPLDESQIVLNAIAHGDFNTTVKGNYKGAFLEMKNNLNDTVAATSSYINEISDNLSFVARGDLTHKISREYMGQFNSIKESINIISDMLSKTMGEIVDVANHMLAACEQVAGGAMSLADGATRQAAAIEELTASVESVNEKTRLSAENATSANEFSKKTSVSASAGNEDMKEMVVSMERIKESSNDISRVMKVIDDIAFQTNLLALNAAVEAARAGEHGRGFAVVAGEVRNLAAKSQQAAHETNDMVEDSNNRVVQGMASANTTATTLEGIVGDVRRFSELTGEIASMSEEQADSISQISIGLNEISQVIQASSATSEEFAATAQELNAQAESLKQMVTEFKLSK